MASVEQMLEHFRRRPDITNSDSRSFSTLSDDDLCRLLQLRHRDPHSILGAHPTKRGGVLFRAYRPDAQKINLLLEGEPPREMRERPEAGMFEVLVEGLRDVPSYKLKVQYPGDYIVTIQSPYSFPPTLGELDIYLWRENKHERIWEKLGAHVREVNGVRGVAFTVWAPGAEGVSVVGNFNSWDGRLDMMRMMGDSGVWELFMPELDEGLIYKFEIRGADGSILMKTDPFA